MTTVIITSVVVFALIIILLVTILLQAKAKLSPSGPVELDINGEKVEVDSGSTLLSTLSQNKIFLPSACGGGGTCAQCRCQVEEGGGEILPTETGFFSRAEIADNWRLGCQVKVKNSMVVELPEDMDYKAGGYIQIEIPETTVNFKDIDITAHPEEHVGEPEKFKEEWDKFNLWPLVMKNEEVVERAYSMASYPAEGRRIMLNVRIATPPWDRNANDWMKVNPGVASSYIFNQKIGDTVTVSGPYGEFFIKDTDAEMLYIGGGAGMAPMRSHLYQLFRTIKTGRKVSYWYGGRSKRELFYIDHFKALEKDFPNFKFYMVLSEPLEEDNWKVKDGLEGEGDGFVGFVHQSLIDNYLSKHDAPEDIEFYFCGPPMMNQAVLGMVDEFGVPPENVAFDDFGG